MSFSRMRRRARAAVAIVSVAVAGVVPVGGAGATQGLPSWCAGTGELSADTLPATIPSDDRCDLTGRVIRSGELAAVVGEPGTAVTAVSLDKTGAQVLSIVVTPEGAVTVDETAPGTDEGIALVPDPLATRPSPDPCAPEAGRSYARMGHKAYSDIAWYYNPASEPQEVSGSALSAIATAASAMANGHNDCGITVFPRDSSQTHVGLTTRAPTNSPCGSDGFNVVGWGVVSGLARICMFSDSSASPRRLIEADIRFNPDEAWTTDTTLCAKRQIGPVNVTPAGRLDLQSSATGAWGKVFGLAEISEDGVGRTQTMSANLDEYCGTNERTLGRGDINGMISLYGSF